MAELLLGDLPLTSGQLAQLRALNTKYFTALAGLERASGSAAGDTAALRVMIAADIRDMLSEEQRVAFDRNLPRVLRSAGET